MDTTPEEHDRPPGWRGTGLWVRGGLRLRDFSLKLNPEQTEIVDSSFVTEVRTDIWPDWLAAAHDATARADAARADGMVAIADDEFRAAVEQEFRASLHGVTAAAFAIDAFYASTVEHAPQTRVKSASRKASILETLKLAYDLKGAQHETARTALSSIFDFRDQGVHPPASWRQPVQHPIYGLGMEPKFVIFRAENSRLAGDFAHRMIWLCLHKPKARHPGLCEWCAGAEELIPAPPE